MIPLFKGCAAALITPFLPDGTLDEEALRALIMMQNDAAMDALVLLGTTGEPCTLTMQEREKVISIGLELANMPVIVGTGANDTKKAIEFAHQAKALGAHGQLCVTPYYNKTTQAGLLRHYTSILNACELPMIVYSVPSRTGMLIDPKTVKQLYDHPGIVGIKESGTDQSAIADLFALCPDLPVYSGNDDAILPIMAQGGSGVISVVANIAPLMTRAVTSSCLQGNYQEAREHQRSLLPLIRMLFSQVSPIPVKAALNMRHLIEDVLRPPLYPLEQPYRQQLRELLSRTSYA